MPGPQPSPVRAEFLGLGTMYHNSKRCSQLILIRSRGWESLALALATSALFSLIPSVCSVSLFHEAWLTGHMALLGCSSPCCRCLSSLKTWGTCEFHLSWFSSCPGKHCILLFCVLVLHPQLGDKALTIRNAVISLSASASLLIAKPPVLKPVLLWC